MKLISVQSRGNRLVRIELHRVKNGYYTNLKQMLPGRLFYKSVAMLNHRSKKQSLKAAAEWLAGAKE